jgi:glycogen synthase
MRVLLVGDYPPPHGGVAVHVQQLHRFLRERGLEVRGLDIGKGARPAPDVLPVRSAPALARELARTRHGVVHLHTSGNNPKAWLVAAAVGAVRSPGGGPRFVTLHSGLVPGFLAGSPARRLAARAALARYAGIVAVSRAVAEAVHALGVPASRLHVHPAFLASQVRPGEPPPALAEVRARRRPLLVFAHHSSPVYGRTAMFAALRRLADLTPGVGLAVFGPGTRTGPFLADARAVGVEALLEDFGELPHATALALLAKADVFVRPTLADGDSISVREALALGVPCVASNVAVRPEGTVTYPVGSTEGLVAAVARALAAGPRRAAGPDAGPFLLARYAEALGLPPETENEGLALAG